MFLFRNSSLSLIKRHAKSILLKFRNTTSPNDQFGFNEKKKPVVLLTNNFEFSVEDISEIYRPPLGDRIPLYKQLKQNFPRHFFYGDSVNAIQIQTWVVLIANLLITVLSRSIKRSCASSQIVTMVRLTLMYYIDFVAFMENPDKTWNNILVKEGQKAPPEPSLFD